MTTGILHPGNMGAALAASMRGELVWAGEGRSAETAARANVAGLRDAGTLSSLVETADVIISVCPPAAAEDLATRVEKLGFAGLYLDANAVSPATSRRIGGLFARYVDGGIVGPPPPRETTDSADRTRLYLSGAEAGQAAGLFTGPGLDVRVIGSEPGVASALKMAFAAWTKGSSALLLAIAAVAAAEGVSRELSDEWKLSLPELGERLDLISSRVGTKAWRFVGEMHEIADAFAEAGLPDGFHRAAGEVYRRLAGLKGGESGQSPEEIVRLLLGPNGKA